eukprot:scaffold10570_cov290-Chaetoceros_neogracile.AAC.18
MIFTFEFDWSLTPFTKQDPSKVPTQLKSGIQMSLSRKISDIEKASMMAINVISDQHKNINHVFFFEKGMPQNHNNEIANTISNSSFLALP